MKNKCLKRVAYKGEMLTLSELSALHGVPASTINNRLTRGWDIEEAITVPGRKGTIAPLPPEFKDGNIVEVVFRRPLGVFAHMQPRLNKRYVVTAHASIHANPVFTITLENGKRLIVYPEEYEIVSVTPGATVAKAC